ncbi:MAG TPA: ABC transporter permease [Candidatus Saccharimonadales bacterium]|nr:ABC transporter permease [Candidatus Saccharimonadales bacterium]
MRFFANFKLAIQNLRSTRVRTTLTIVGIIIGITSVTAILSLSEGAKNNIRGQVSELGDDILTIRPGKAHRDEDGFLKDYNYLAAFGTSTITESDLESIKHNSNVSQIAPLMLVTGSVSDMDKKLSSGVIVGTTADGDEALGLSVNAGEFISSTSGTDKVVLGRNLALEMFGSEVTTGQKVLIRGHEYTVVGVLGYFPSSTTVSTVFDLNNAAFISLPAAKSFNQGVAQIQQLNLRLQPGVDAKTEAETIHQKLISNHHNEDDVAVLLPAETIQIADSILGTFSNVISAVAAISIIVGGVGIMNIMLVSVTERTREIGIRKAIGATNSQVLSQFMIEALVMSLAGGFLGIVVGFGLAYAAGTFIGFMPGFTWQIIAASLTISLAVGVVFGAWPAIKAARKDPIEALRSFN